MTATALTPATSRPAARPATERQRATALGTLLHRWSDARRARQHLVEKRRFDARDRSDGYIDRPGGTFRQDLLVRFTLR
jgi:hypothetical protein